jgi:hypothetical protein
MGCALLYPVLPEDRMSRTALQILHMNEKLKTASGVVTNLAAALFATALGRWFLTGFDPIVAVWLTGAISVMGIGMEMPSYLEAENSDG